MSVYKTVIERMVPFTSNFAKSVLNMFFFKSKLLPNCPLEVPNGES